MEESIDLKKLEQMMEEMANMPKEELGKRQPGERQAREIYADVKHYDPVLSETRSKTIKTRDRNFMSEKYQ